MVYYVYVLLKDSTPIYVGVTNNIDRRIYQHSRSKYFDKYRIVKEYNNRKDAFNAENAIIRYSSMFYSETLINAKDKNILMENMYKNG